MSIKKFRAYFENKSESGTNWSHFEDWKIFDTSMINFLANVKKEELENLSDYTSSIEDETDIKVEMNLAVSISKIGNVLFSLEINFSVIADGWHHPSKVNELGSTFTYLDSTINRIKTGLEYKDESFLGGVNTDSSVHYTGRGRDFKKVSGYSFRYILRKSEDRWLGEIEKLYTKWLNNSDGYERLRRFVDGIASELKDYLDDNLNYDSIRGQFAGSTVDDMVKVIQDEQIFYILLGGDEVAEIPNGSDTRSTGRLGEPSKMIDWKFVNNFIKSLNGR